MQDRAVPKKMCANSHTLPASEVRFFANKTVVTLSSLPKATAVCGVKEPYYVVNARLPMAS